MWSKVNVSEHVHDVCRRERLRRRFGIALLLLFVSIFFTHCQSKQAERYVGGIQVNEASQQEWVETLKENGLNTVSLTVYAYQGDWDGTKLRFKESNPGIIEELRAAKKGGLKTVLIVRMGLDSAYPRNEFLWHGMIAPHTEKDIDGWFDNYGDFVLKWAKIAERYEVDIFGIGSELTALTSTKKIDTIPELEAYHLSIETEEREFAELEQKKSKLISHELASSLKKYDSYEKFFRAKKAALREWAQAVTFNGSKDRVSTMNAHRQNLEEHWRSLIAAVRGVYSGKLTYAAGFDQYQAVGFWDALDIIGINAYFKLREGDRDFVDEQDLEQILTASWEDVLDDIITYRKEEEITSLPVLFTEIGYTFRKNSTVYPWASESFDLVGDGDNKEVYVWDNEPHNFTERIIAMRSLRKALNIRPKDLFAGLLYWKFSTHDYHIDDEPFVHILGWEPDMQFTEELKKFLQ